MSKFNADQFMLDFTKTPSKDKIDVLLRLQLFALGKKLNLSLTPQLKKIEMKQFVLEYFVDNGILDDSVINDFEVDRTSADQKEVHLARMKHELDLAKLNQELEMKKVEKGIPSSVSTGVPKFDVTKHIRLVPHFSEDDVDKYFIMFEKVAKSLTWPKDQWVLLLQSVLKGKAQETYSALSVSDCDSYDTVKQVILKSYELVPEAYRQRFRNLKKSEGQTFVEYARDKEVLFDRWCASREVVEDFENLKQLIIVEEFKRCIHNDIRTHLDESNVTDLRAAAIKADDYALTHKSNLNQSKHNVSMRRNNGQGFSARQYASDKSKEGFPPRQFSNDGKNKEGFPPRQSANDSKGKEATKSGGQFLKSDNLVGPCWYCKENGHTRANCRAWIAAGRPSTKSVDHVTTPQVSNLISTQKNDPELKSLYSGALSEAEAASYPCCYFIQNDVLMRKRRPPDASVDDEWLVQYQIVVPSPYRSHILNLAHDIPMAGHLGVRKTYLRVLEHFCWPGLKKDVVNYCRTCHTCQVIGKPNQKPPKAPLRPIPAFKSHFSELIIDCVGPLPKSKSGKQYLLTIMCASTRFPEAIPLSNIRTPAICEALKCYFSRVGLPISIRSDQGSNFQSHKFKQFLKELGIEQKKSSAWHPESQGALERFHQTFKTMLKCYCEDHERDWDVGVPLLLFAVRDSTQESLGFSPFQLVFGHKVRGPLKLIKEKWLDTNEQTDLLSYVMSFKERLTEACELASKHLSNAQTKMKTWYDRNSVKRSFNEGDQVPVLLPSPGKPLQAAYFGPYTVLKKVDELNYVVKTPNRRKAKQMCHINMIKPYYSRDHNESVLKTVYCPLTPVIKCDGDESVDFQIPDCNVKLNNTKALANLKDSKLSHLTPSQQSDMESLILEYKDLFSDTPTRTDTVYHDIELINDNPIKQHPYRVNPMKQEILDQEIKYMLENNIIEKSKSPWSSPCILVPKPDKSYRFCTDFRKVNSATKSDTYPIPRIDDCIDRIGNAVYISKFDLLKGYWQIPLTDRAKEISAFTIPGGLINTKLCLLG